MNFQGAQVHETFLAIRTFVRSFATMAVSRVRDQFDFVSESFVAKLAREPSFVRVNHHMLIQGGLIRQEFSAHSTFKTWRATTIRLLMPLQSCSGRK